MRSVFINKRSILSVIFLILTTLAFSSSAVAQTQLRLAKTWSNALLGDEITATTSGAAVATINSISGGINTDFGTPVAVNVGDMITLNAEVFNMGLAVNYFISDWVCDDAASSTIPAGGTLEVMAGDLNNTITCTVTNQLKNIIEGISCLNNPDPATFIPNCTANDLALSSPAVSIIKDCNFPGDTAILEVDTVITTTATKRYDIGLWFSLDGDPNADGSKSGLCTVVSVPNNLIDSDGNPTDQDGDFCGDVTTTTAGPPDVPQTPLGTFSLPCVDTDGDGFLDVPLLIAYDNAAGNVCTTADAAIPPNKAKCQVDLTQQIPVPIPGKITVDKVTVPADATDFDFTLSGPDSGIVGGFVSPHDFTLNDASAPFDTSIFTGGLPADPAGTAYSVTEDANAAYSTVASCVSDLNGAIPDPSNITLFPGESIDCTFTNTLLQATINVVKNTSGGNGPFDIDWQGPTTSGTFNLDTGVINNDTDQLITTDLGIWSLTEDIPLGWALASAGCTNDNGGATVGTYDGVDGVNNINLMSGMSITCTFNNAALGSVTVTKNTVGGDGTFDYNSDLPGGDFVIMTAVQNMYAEQNVPAGTYTITEDPEPGWISDPNNPPTCGAAGTPASFDVADGDNVNCTFTNIKLGTIIIVKDTVPDGPQDFSFTSTGGLNPAAFDLDDDADGTLSNTQTFNNVTPGAYTVTEAATAGFDLTGLSCDDPDGGSSEQDSTATIDLDAGETVTCTFTNTQRGSIEVRKELTAVNGIASQDFNFMSAGGFFFDGVGGSDTTETLSPTDAGMANLATTGAIPVLPGNTYTVSETPLTDGWQLVSASCEDGSNPAVGIDVAPGEAVVCTFINSLLGSATIIKETIGGDDAFSFTADAPMGLFEIDTAVDNQVDFTNVLTEGQYDVTEDGETGWTLTDLTCTEDGDQDSDDTNWPTAVVDVELDETVSCTFENTADGTVIIRKETIPDASLAGFDFLSADGLDGTIHDFSDTGEELSVSGLPGTYGAMEDVPVGWEVTNISCASDAVAPNSTWLIGVDGDFDMGDVEVDVTVAAGETVTCVFENTAQGSITIEKETIGDVGLFTFNGTFGSFDLDTNANGNPDSRQYTALLPGQYTVGEIVPSFWDLTDIQCSGGVDVLIGGDSDFDPNDTGVTINLASGENVVCRFFNTKDGRIRVEKQTLPDGSPTGFDFAGDASATGLTDDNFSAWFSYQPGIYMSEETVPGGWDLTDITCSDVDDQVGASSGDIVSGIATFDLQAGEDVTCTFTNTQRATITLEKNLPNDDGGTATQDQFQAYLDAVTPGTTPVAWDTPIEVLPNVTYTAAEDTLPGYDPGNGWFNACAANGEVTPGPGESLTCEITNDDVAPVLTIIKTVVNDDGGTATAGMWNMDVTATNPSSTGFPGAEAPGVDITVDANADYSVDESGGPSGYAKTLGAGCTGNLGPGETATCEITNDDVAPVLTIIKTVVNDDGGTATAGMWNMDVTATNPSSTGFPGVEAPGVDITVDANEPYSVDESGGPSGYAKTLGGGCAGTLLPGETAVCEITNDDIAPVLTIIKTVVNDDGGDALAGAWTMDVTATNPSATGFPGVEAPGVDITVDANEPYSVDESGGPSGYAKTLGGGCAGTLLPGETAVCEITNDDIAPVLTIIKTVVNDDGGDALAGAWTMDVTATNPSATGFPGVEAPGVDITVDANEPYSVDESGGPSGYAKTLGGGCAGTLLPGETAVCEITNDDIAPVLTIIKTVVNDDGGDALAGAWTMDVTATNPSATGFPGVEAPGVDITVDANEPYSVDESGGPSGYAKTLGGGCAGTLLPGETAVCEITNDDISPILTLIKVVDSELGGSAEPGDWQLTATGPVTESGNGGWSTTVPPGTYTLSESFLGSQNEGSFYVAEGWECDGGSQDGDNITLALADEVTCSIVNRYVLLQPVPVNNVWALLLLTLMMLATGWYFRPAHMRRF